MRLLVLICIPLFSLQASTYFEKIEKKRMSVRDIGENDPL